ncbi:unnamed protein product, partial [Coregonus sp. 'balchen']
VSVSSVLCLSSVRELPVQVRELYGQGFVLWAGRRLETDVCVAGQQAPDPDVIQNYVKKQPGGGPCFLGHMDPEDLSSLHSSPSPIHRHPASTTARCSEPTITELSPTDSTEPHQNLLEPEHDRNTELKTPEYKSVELRTIEQNPTDTSQVELDLSSTELVENTQVSTSVESTDREHIHSPVRIPSIEDQPNHCPIEPAEPPERLQSPSPIDPACDQQNHNHVPTELRGDQDQLQSCNPIETTCIERQQNESQADFIRTLLPNFSPAELTHGLGGPDADRQRQGDIKSPSPQTQNQRWIPEQFYSTDDLVRSPELDNADRGSESGAERGCNRGNGGTDGDLDEHQRSSRVPTHNNNNHIRVKSPDRDKRAVGSPPAQSRVQLFALYNHTGELSSSLRFYSLRVPLGLQREAGLVTEVDAHWLDHMTQHFTSGARLIDGFFHLGDDNVVRTDYIPLLQSLAPYGWRLMCVLPTPIKLNLRGLNKAKKNSAGEMLKEERKNTSPVMERGMDGQKRNTEEEEREEEERECETEYQEDFPQGTEDGATDLNQEVEQENGKVPLARQEKAVRFADVNQKNDEVKSEEKITQQLTGFCRSRSAAWSRMEYRGLMPTPPATNNRSTQGSEGRGSKKKLPPTRIATWESTVHCERETEREKEE